MCSKGLLCAHLRSLQQVVKATHHQKGKTARRDSTIMPSPARSRRAASPSASTSPTGETTPPSTNSNNHTTKQQTTNTNTTHPQAIAAAPSKPGQAPPHNQYLVTLVTFASILGTTATAIIGGMAALLSSKTFALVLWAFAPHADDLWGLKVVAAVLRLAYLGAVALRVLAAERPENPLPALGAALARLATTAAVECSVLFSQPAFATVAGGTFKVGDASKAAIGRFGRTAWLATTPQLSIATSAVLAAALAVAVADRLSMPSKALLRGYPRLAVSVVAKGAKTVCLAALYPRLRSLAIRCVRPRLARALHRTAPHCTALHAARGTHLARARARAQCRGLR